MLRTWLLRMIAAESRAVAAEFLGTAFLLAAVVGSGIMGDRLSGGNAAIALLANSVATGAALVALILTFGAQMNPIVTLVSLWQRALEPGLALAYVGAQVAGAVSGVVAAHLMFEAPLLSWSTHVRSGAPQAFSEGVATFGLLAVVIACSRRRPESVPIAVATYITAAYWFTASTSFANPAVTMARALTDTFSGIRPTDVPAFVAAQVVGAALATVAIGWLVPALAESAGARREEAR